MTWISRRSRTPQDVPADSLVVVLLSAEHASWLDEASVDEGFERFGIPVEYVLPDGSAIRR